MPPPQHAWGTGGALHPTCIAHIGPRCATRPTAQDTMGPWHPTAHFAWGPGCVTHPMAWHVGSQGCRIPQHHIPWAITPVHSHGAEGLSPPSLPPLPHCPSCPPWGLCRASGHMQGCRREQSMGQASSCSWEPLSSPCPPGTSPTLLCRDRPSGVGWLFLGTVPSVWPPLAPRCGSSPEPGLRLLQLPPRKSGPDPCWQGKRDVVCRAAGSIPSPGDV